MKKILLFITTLLFSATFFTNAQIWNFDNSADGWVPVAATKTLNDTYLTITSKDGVANPGLKIDDPGIDVTTVHVLAITMKNKSATGPDIIRSAITTDGGNIYLSTPITKGDTEYKTYYIDYSGDKWSGNVATVKLLFKGADNTDYVGTGAEEFDIDKIEMLDAIPVIEKHIWSFDTDGDSEFWESVNGSINSVSGGILTFTPIANKYAKLTQPDNYVVADDYNWLRLKVKNNSTGDNQITLITSIARIGFAVTTGDTEFKTYEILLDTIGGGTSWTGNAEDITLRFADAATGKSTGTGSFEIDLIEFFYAPSTSISKNESSRLTIGPNPSTGYFRINSEKVISGYTVFNTTGQVVKQVSSLNTLSANVDISGSTKGMYFIKVNYENGGSQVVQAIVR